MSDGTEGGALAGLLHKILLDLGISPAKVNRLVDKYLLEYHRKNKGRKNSVNRVHLVSKISDQAITWKTFMFTIFNIINVKKMKITVALIHSNNQHTVHEFTISHLDSSEDLETKTAPIYTPFKNKTMECIFVLEHCDDETIYKLLGLNDMTRKSQSRLTEWYDEIKEYINTSTLPIESAKNKLDMIYNENKAKFKKEKSK